MSLATASPDTGPLETKRVTVTVTATGPGSITFAYANRVGNRVGDVCRRRVS
jgi:hypothetical protein